MTRPFRIEEDERRYFALRSEFFIALVRSGLPSQVVHTIMRNFGKLEDSMFFEGVRQGMSASVLAPAVDPNAKWFDMHPFDVHASVYHAAQTPLVRVERALIEQSGSGHGYDIHWLDGEPFQFGPLTLSEAIEQYGPDLKVDPPRHVPSRVAEPEPAESAGPEDMRSIVDRLSNGEGFESVFGELPETELADPIAETPDPNAHPEPLERPELLDRIREYLLDTKSTPASWQDLILSLHRQLKVDAGVLDQIMSGPMGMTVLSQAELFYLHPGSTEGIVFITR